MTGSLRNERKEVKCNKRRKLGRRPIAEWIVRVGVVGAAFVCLQGRGVQGTQRPLDSWLAGHVLLQGTIIPPAHTEGKTSTIETKCWRGLRFGQEGLMIQWLEIFLSLFVASRLAACVPCAADQLGRGWWPARQWGARCPLGRTGRTVQVGKSDQGGGIRSQGQLEIKSKV